MRKKYISFLASLSVMFFFVSGERSLAVPVMTAPNCYVDKGLKDFSAVSTHRFTDTYHVFSHGRPGYLLIEGRWLGAKELAVFLARHVSLSITHLNVYGCNFGYGAEGKTAVSYLKNKLGVTVSASDDITGKDGDWELEVGEQGQEALRIAYEGNLQCTDPKKLLGACDFDGDGILNNVDLDDDNDGVLDSQECSNRTHLTGTWTSTSTGIYEASIGTTGIKARVTFGNYANFWASAAPTNSTWNASCDAMTSGAGALGGKAALLVTTAHDLGGSSGRLKIEFINSSGQAVFVENPLIHFARVGGYISTTTGTTTSSILTSSEWVLQNGQTWAALSKDDLTTTNTSLVHSLLGKDAVEDMSTCATGAGSGTFRINNNVSVIDFNVRELINSTTESSSAVDGLDFIIEADICTIDSDKDGVTNDKDPDSDGDGCFDSYEAGVLGATKSGASTDSIATAPYGSNGLANSLENNDTDAATVTYNNQYAVYALSNILNVCADTDGDGIGDLVDIDDDNDGVLDAEESPSCYYTDAESGKVLSVSSELASYSSTVPSNTIDNNASTFNAFNGAINWVDKELYKLTLSTPLAIDSMKLDLTFSPLSSNASQTFKMQGSNDNVAWTDLSAPVASTAGTGTFSIANTQTAPLKYTYYRLFGVVGSSSYGGVAEIKLIPYNYTASSYPKSTCTTDTDNDGIVNHLDPDSDGDGCFDSYEAGVTTLLGIAPSEATAPAPYGSNGFSNSVETAAESNTYKGMYTYANATDATVANCPKIGKCSDFTNEESACTAAASDATFGKLDCDGDGVTNSKECAGGTDPKDPCSYNADSVTLEKSVAWDTLDCDNDGKPNREDPKPKDPCVNGYLTDTAFCAAVSRMNVVALDTIDCDGDGVTNGKECTDGTSPLDPCSRTRLSISKPVTADTSSCNPCSQFSNGDSLCAAVSRNVPMGIATTDCDGDGVTNSKECAGGTNPLDPCSYNADSVTLEKSVAWDTLDCDNDGKPNREDPKPKDPCVNGYLTDTAFCAAVSRMNVVALDTIDCDGDGVTNSKECTDGTSPLDPCSRTRSSISKPVTADTSSCNACSQFSNGDSLCAAVERNVPMGIATTDCDGDGVMNSKECAGGTNPLDPCSYNADSVTLEKSVAWDTLDCDNDGKPNREDPKPKDPCVNGYLTDTAFCAAVSRMNVVALDTIDCDGDGVTNSKECTDGTSPLDPCSRTRLSHQ